MKRFSITTRPVLMSYLLAVGILCSSMAVVQAADTVKKQKLGEALLPELEKEVRSVSFKARGLKGKGINKTNRKVHVSYTSPFMDAFIGTSGELYVQPKVSSRGNSLCGTIMITPHNYYTDTSGDRARQKLRKVISAKSSVQPSKNPKKVTIQFELEQGVQCTVVYQFNGKEIELEMETDDPKGVDYPTTPKLSARIPKSHDIPMAASMAVKKSTTKNCLLSLKGDKHVYSDFSKSTGKKKYVSYGAITGHWPGCEVKFGARPGLGLYVYQGSMLFEGYDLLAGGEKGATKKKMSIEVTGAK